MSDATSKTERFAMLLNHIETPQEWIDRYFDQGEIEKLSVFRTEKRWHFEFQLDDILPYQVYEWLAANLQKHFQTVVPNVTFTIQSRKSEGADPNFADYWKPISQQLSQEFPALKMCLCRQQPELHDRQLIFAANSETEAGLLKRKIPKALDRKSVV